MQNLQAHIAALQGKLDATLKRFDVVQQHCLAVETEIVDEVSFRSNTVHVWYMVTSCERVVSSICVLNTETPVCVQVRSRLGFLKERLIQTISEVLAADSQPPASGRWRSVWEKARSFVARQDQETALQQRLVSPTWRHFMPVLLHTWLLCPLRLVGVPCFGHRVPCSYSTLLVTELENQICCFFAG